MWSTTAPKKKKSLPLLYQKKQSKNNSTATAKEMIYDIIIHISSFLLPKKSMILLTMNRCITRMSERARYERKIQDLAYSFPSLLRPFVLQMDILDIGKRTGSTDYIDFIKKSEMKWPVMVGRDIFKRVFISFKHEQGVMTLFQRYTSSPLYFTTGGSYPESVQGRSGGLQMEPQNSSLQGDDRFRYIMTKLMSLHGDVQ